MAIAYAYAQVTSNAIPSTLFPRISPGRAGENRGLFLGFHYWQVAVAYLADDPPPILYF